MKKIILGLLTLTVFAGYSQAITVNTNLYTVPQLVNNVLINTPNILATNVTWRTGTNFGSSNGIGYFQNTNQTFPMESGVVLSTGNVLNTVGPNLSILSDGSSSWTGDANLQNAMSGFSGNANFVNATVLEFDFVALSTNFNLDFLFASEEYGEYQCTFSDSFVILLTNLNTGVTTNLAVVPGTNIPISVTSVRNSLYNTNCPSSNSEYFGVFNGGTNASASATNFNGQTVKMSATTSLEPITPYHLKIVVADRADSVFDSALFLGANSLNIGQNFLGPDLTIADNTAVCQGNNITLATGLSASNYTFLWKKDGVVIGANSSLVVNQPGTYTVDVTNNTTSLLVSDTVIVEFYEQLQIEQPQNLMINESNFDGFANFNLTSQIPFILIGLNQDDFEVNFYESLSDATIGFNPITDPANFTNISNPQNIYVRVESFISGCVEITSFSIEVVDSSLAVTDFDMKNIRISPNPIVDFMTVSANENINSIAIFNTLGQLVFEKKVNSSKEKIDLTALISGNYIVKITSETSSKGLKIIKQ